MRTHLTDLLGIQYPILLPGMSWIPTKHRALEMTSSSRGSRQIPDLGE